MPKGHRVPDWATKTRRDHLIQGFTLNQKRLLQRGVEIADAVALLSTTLQNQRLISDPGQVVLDVVRGYAKSWRILRAYHGGQLATAPTQASVPSASLDLADVLETIRTLPDQIVAAGENSGLVGPARDETLGSILHHLDQTWGGEPLYPTLEARAATSSTSSSRNTRSQMATSEPARYFS
ncbi:MAG: hypothetical protein ACRENX_08240 [Candidatus Dormibacteria bacterium]